MLDFKDRFDQFETEAKTLLSDLQKRSNAMGNNFANKLSIHDETLAQTKKRLLFLEQNSTIIKQDLQSHKLQKERQIGDLQDKHKDIIE